MNAFLCAYPRLGGEGFNSDAYAVAIAGSKPLISRTIR